MTMIIHFFPRRSTMTSSKYFRQEAHRLFNSMFSSRTPQETPIPSMHPTPEQSPRHLTAAEVGGRSRSHSRSPRQTRNLTEAQIRQRSRSRSDSSSSSSSDKSWNRYLKKK